MPTAPRRTLLALAAVVALAVGAGCSSPTDHPELAVQRLEDESFVVHLLDCDDDVDLVRVVQDYGREQVELVAAQPDAAAGEHVDVVVERTPWAPRMLLAVEGSTSYEATFDPDDVPPVPELLLVPDAAEGEEVVELQDYLERCS